VWGSPYRKLLPLRLAALQICRGKYGDAAYNFKQFSMESVDLPVAKIRAKFYAAICSLATSSVPFREYMIAIGEIAKAARSCPCSRTALAIPLVAFELQMQRREFADPLVWFRRYVLDALDCLRKWSYSCQNLIGGILKEREAGFAERRRQLLLLDNASVGYRNAGHLEGHALRLAIWLMMLLPEKQWVRLRQTVWLQKANLLATLSCGMRSLRCCKQLLEDRNLDRALHGPAITQLWTPFNAPDFDVDESLEMQSLVDIKKTVTRDRGDPQYYDIPKGEFAELEMSFKKWLKLHTGSMRESRLEEMWERKESEVYDYRLVACDAVVKLIISLYNRYTFAVHLDDPHFVARPEDDDPEASWEFTKISSQVLPPTKKEILLFEFRPKTPGRFVIDKFFMRLWGHIGTNVKCRLPILIVDRDHPMMSIQICGLPDVIYQDGCYEFYLRVKNCGGNPVNEYRVVFDLPGFLMYTGTGKLTPFGQIQIVVISEPLDVGQPVRLPFVLRIPERKLIRLRFFLDVSGHRMGFAKYELKLSRAVEVSTESIPNKRNWGNDIIQCVITALTDGVEILGIADPRGKFLRILRPQTDLILNRGEATQIIAFSAEATDSGIAEWRLLSVEDPGFTLLYRLPSSRLESQQKLAFELSHAEERFTLTLPSEVKAKIGQLGQCELRMEEPKHPVYVEPLPFDFVTEPGSVRRLNGCRWTGKTRLQLCEKSDFRVTFSFMMFTGGLYRLQGVTLSETPGFEKPTEVLCGQRMLVDMT
jgi:hypothetical protein